MSVAPEHVLVDDLTGTAWPDGTDPRWTYGAATPGEAVASYRRAIATKSDLERWRQNFQPPDADELETADIDPPPEGFDSWEAWVAQWWPSSLPGYGST